MSFPAIETSRQRGEPATLYLFVYRGAEGDEAPAYFGYTDAESEIARGGFLYEPIPIMRDAIASSGTLDKSMLQVRMPRDVEISELFRVWPPAQPVTLIIRQGHLSDASAEFLVCWSGRVLAVGREGDECVVGCEPVSSSLRRPGLRRHYQLGCPHVLYGPQCQANKAAATVTAVVASISGTSLTLSPGWNGAFAAAKFVEGMAEWVNGDGGTERRKILSVSGNTLLLGGLIRDLAVSDNVDVVLGCNHQMSDCQGLFDNILNFGGCPWIPVKNPIGFRNQYYQMAWFVTLLIAIALQVIAYLLAPKPKKQKPPEVEDLDNPVADAGMPLPVPFGTLTVKGLNVLHFGDKRKSTWETEDNTRVTEYFASVHFGICHGPLDAILQIVIQDKEAWAGEQSAQATIDIDKPQLFGGVKKEGGVEGQIHYLPGGPAQTVPENLAQKAGRTTATMPAYRGIASVWFFEEADSRGTGFSWTANSPYLPGVWVKVSRTSAGLGGGNARIGADSNPAHIIYEALTHTDWGMGAPASAIDVASFTAAAAALFAENFGLSMMWTQQSTIEAFISEVIDHIEATLFVSPRTGLLTLKLIRDDYEVAGLPVFTPDNSTVTNFQRKLWGETVNEIVASWTNPENEETETVVAQDNANIATQGGIVSDGRNYYGIRNKTLAMRTAQRDLRAAATPLASCDIVVNRAAWALLPGDVCVLDSPDDGIDQIVMRVGPVDYGKPGEPAVKASLAEDVWSLALSEYTVPPDSEAEPTSEEPTPADHTLIFTLPRFDVVNRIDPAVVSFDYPKVFAGVLASEAGTDGGEFDLLGEVTGPGGGTSFADIGTKTLVSRGTLPDALVAEIETTIVSFPDRTQGDGPTVGGFMLIEGPEPVEGTSELCLVTAFGGSPSAYTFQRGALDTVPRDWPAGTPVWFFDPSTVYADRTVRAAADTVDYKVLIRTSLGLLDEASAPIVSETLTARPHLPLRPADVLVNGDDGFSGPVDLVGIDPIPTEWARRNRLTEDAVVLPWDAADVTPEAGQTTTVRLTDTVGNVLHEYTGIAGTSQAVDPADFGAEAGGFIVFVSERDGLESLQGFAVRVMIEDTIPTADVTTVTADDTTISVDAE